MRKRILILSAMLGLCSILAFSNYFYFELLSHFRVQYVFVSLLFAVVAIFTKQYRLMVLLVFIAGLNGYVITSMWTIKAEPEKQNKERTAVKLLHSNVNTANTEYHKLIALLKKEKPDILVLQEINHGWVSGIGEVLDDYAYGLVQTQEDNFGIGLWSHYPLTDKKVISLGGSEIPSLEVKVEINGKTLAIIATHPLPPMSKQYFKARNTQLEAVASHIAEIDGSRLLVGDLNTSPWSSYYRKLEVDSGLKNARSMGSLVPTWPVFFPLAYIPIDHVLISKDIVALEFRRGKAIGSDHYPVVFRFFME